MNLAYLLILIAMYCASWVAFLFKEYSIITFYIGISEIHGGLFRKNWRSIPKKISCSYSKRISIFGVNNNVIRVQCNVGTSENTLYFFCTSTFRRSCTHFKCNHHMSKRILIKISFEIKIIWFLVNTIHLL